MTKRRLIALADMIRANPDAFSPSAVRLLANFCASQNPRFKCSRWMDYIAGLCGPNGGKIKPSKK